MKPCFADGERRPRLSARIEMHCCCSIVRLAAADWADAPTARKADFLVHRETRLAEAEALALRGPNWAREIDAAQAYLTACAEHEKGEKRSKHRSRTIVGILAAIIATGALVALNFDRLRNASYWLFHVRGFIKSQAEERERSSTIACRSTNAAIVHR